MGETGRVKGLFGTGGGGDDGFGDVLKYEKDAKHSSREGLGIDDQDMP